MGNEVKVSAEEFQKLIRRVEELEAVVLRIETENTKSSNKSQREMTDTDAYKILTGEHSELSHNKAAQILGLSYGQVYSCRLGYTFRHIHKKLQADGFVNKWLNKDK